MNFFFLDFCALEAFHYYNIIIITIIKNIIIIKLKQIEWKYMIVLCSIGRVNIVSDVMISIELMWDRRNWSKWGVSCCSRRGDNNIRLSVWHQDMGNSVLIYISPFYYQISSVQAWSRNCFYWNWKKSPHGVFIHIKIKYFLGPPRVLLRSTTLLHLTFACSH